jgi:hypothetical protein
LRESSSSSSIVVILVVVVVALLVSLIFFMTKKGWLGLGGRRQKKGQKWGDFGPALERPAIFGWREEYFEVLAIPKTAVG